MNYYTETIILAIIIIVFSAFSLALILIGLGVKRWKRAVVIMTTLAIIIITGPFIANSVLKLFPGCDQQIEFIKDEGFIKPTVVTKCDCLGLKIDENFFSFTEFFQPYSALDPNKCVGVITKTWTEQVTRR